MEWKDDGIIIASDLEEKDDILKSEGLNKAEVLGKNI
jgi:hypothetical protein